jgi:ATP-binding cassette subfamily B protein
MIMVMLVMSIASAQRIVQVITQVSYLESPKDGVKEVKNGEVVFDKTCFNYAGDLNDPLVLDDINLTIESGSTLGILGATGSAKSTLVQLIPRLYDATTGSVKVAGVDVKDYDLKTLRDNVAMVLQKNVLFSGTIIENMRWGDPDATLEEIEEACTLAQADEFIQRMPDKYNTYIEQGGTNVSGGQRQRLCIARALLKKPKILILDDSTSAVDTHTDALIREAFLKKIPDTTRIIISQRISSIQDADKIVVLDNGKISAIGSHEELLKNSDIYSQTFEQQQKGGDFDEQ